jgi:hypothetical protein
MVNGDAVGVELWSATTSAAAFGSGLDSFGGVQLGPGRRRRRLDWAAGTFGFGRRFTGVEEQRVFCFLACVEEVVVCFVLFDFFRSMLTCQPFIGRQKMPSFCQDQIEVIPLVKKTCYTSFLLVLFSSSHFSKLLLDL